MTGRTQIRPVAKIHPTVSFDPALVRVIETAAGATGVNWMRMVSGAFHDAMFLADCCPTAMIFVPSRAGVSHHPDEFSSPADVMAGTRVLTRTLLEVAT